MVTKPWALTAALFCAWIAAPALAAAQDADDIEQGRRLYEGMCVTCHGYAGAGGEAPSLSGQLNQTDDTLRNIIGNGMPNRGMPRVRRMTDNELTQIIGYLRSLGRTAAAAPPPGNAERGAEIYRRQAVTLSEDREAASGRN
jgi:mono/diheme cytochrome c family protein